MAADILASAVEQTANAPESVIDAARERGRAIAVQRTDAPDPRGRLVELLAGNGYEPMAEPDGSILLPNCPFDALVREHRNLTCSMNLALLSSVTQVLDQAGLHAVAAPRDGFCCVALVPENHSGPSDVSPGEVNAMDAPSGPKER
jgi:predicted ArsR family transcriptional regulator